MKREKKIFTLILTLFFLSWISLPLLNEPFQFYKEPQISKTENRNLARKPIFDINLLDPYPGRYEKYFNDHFIFRPSILDFYTFFNFFLIGESPFPDEVAVGHDGWYYLAQKEKKVYNGEFTLTSAQCLQIAQELKRRTKQLEGKNIKFYVVFAPTKQEIYPEFLPPDYIRCNKATVTEKITEMVRKTGGINLIEIKAPLLSAKKSGRLYLKTDNHWSYRGGYFAYREIIRCIRKDFPDVPEVTERDFSFKDTVRSSGNLAIMIGLSDYLKEETINVNFVHPRATPGIEAGYKPIKPWEDAAGVEVVREIKDSTLPKILVFRDSFTNAIMPFLNESFRKTVYIFDGWRYGSNEMIVENEKPDIVLLIIYEPHISNILGKL